MKQILALINIFILFGIIIATFIASLLGVKKEILFVLIFCNVAYPVLLFVILNFYKPNDNKKNL